MKTIRFLCIALLAVSAGSCKDKSPITDYSNLRFVHINESDIRLQADETYRVGVSFDTFGSADKNYTWKVYDPKVASIVANEDNSAMLTAISEGITTIEIVSDDEKLRSFATVNVRPIHTLTDKILIDFGAVSFGPPFNTYVDPKAVINDLVDEKGVSSGYSIKVSGEFGLLKRIGKITSDIFPDDVAGDMFFNDGLTADLVIFGLKKTQKYSFALYGSVNDNRGVVQTEYVVSGKNEGSATLITSYNYGNFAVIRDIYPDDDAQITVTVRPGPDNTHMFKFCCISVMVIAPEGVI